MTAPRSVLGSGYITPVGVLQIATPATIVIRLKTSPKLAPHMPVVTHVGCLLITGRGTDRAVAVADRLYGQGVGREGRKGCGEPAISRLPMCPCHLQVWLLCQHGTHHEDTGRFLALLALYTPHAAPPLL